MQKDIYDDAEWRLPPLRRFLDVDFFGPILVYFFCFCMIRKWVFTNFWNNYHSFFTRYRLQNTTVSLIHSSITGGGALIFMLINRKVMYEETIYWYRTWAAQLVFVSMGYFVYDMLDVLKNEGSRYAYEVALHHVVAFAIFSAGMLPRKFLPYAYWALLVEVNCVFLHARSILQISVEKDVTSFAYSVVKFMSLVTFIVFRFGVLIWMLKFMVVNWQYFHPFYSISGGIAVSFFLVLSVFLFFRTFSDDRLSSRDQSASKRALEESIESEEYVKLS